MLFHVQMDVQIPQGLNPDVAAQLIAKEKAYAQELQRSGKWRHIWRIVGEYANYSIFDVKDNAELHQLLSNLPLYQFMKISVTPLCRHPSSVREDDS
tara:strand:- start:18754 stop:19044 length:291 start_codon:yes stop_codon:yes gene_type:complete